MIILGIDPGTASIGFGVIEYINKKSSLKEYGCLKTSPADTTATRLCDLYRELSELIEKYKPALMAVEDIFFFKNLKTVVKVSQARGVILLCGANHHLAVAEFTPLQVKQAVTGYGRAEKAQVQKMVKAILALKEIPRPDDAADALAVALCCAHSYPQLKNIGLLTSKK